LSYVDYNDYPPSDCDLNDNDDIEKCTLNPRKYRRYMNAVKDKRLRKILNYGYIPHAGWVEHDFVDGEHVCVGRYIKYPRNSNAQRFLKRYSNRIVRKSPISRKGAGYKKLFDYWWSLY